MKTIAIRGLWAGVILMELATCLSSARAAEPEPTGASIAWTSSDPAVVRARKLLEKGEFTRAEAEIELGVSDPIVRAEALEIIGRLRHEYSLSAGDLVARLRETIPNVAESDVERWRVAGGVQWRMIDGRPAFFRREPANLFRFCDEAKQRRVVKAEPPSEGWTLVGHLRQVIAEADRSGAEHVFPVRHRVTHGLTVPANTAGMKAGAVVRVWLPFPAEHERQRGVKLISASPAGAVIAPADAPQRTIYFECKVADPAKPLEFSEVIEFTSLAYYPKLDDARALPLSASFAGGCLNERAPHIVFTPQVRKIVADAVGDEINPLIRARRLYHWITDHIAYDAEEEYCVIPSFTAKAITTRRGDCGVQSMLFITLCRCAGIPARWQSGWETKPVGWDMHDWAEFYVEPWGWLPADPSYGPQKSEDPRVREFYFGHQDSYRLIVNRDYGSELHPAKRSLRSEPADFQRGEVEIDGKNLYFDQWDYDVKFETR